MRTHPNILVDEIISQEVRVVKIRENGCSR